MASMRPPHVLFALSLVAGLISFAIGFFVDTGFSINLVPWDQAFVFGMFLSLAVFVLSSLFFGYGAIVGFAAAGFHLGDALNGFLTSELFYLNSLVAIPVIVAGYAGILFGRSTLADLNGRSNLRKFTYLVGRLVVLSLAMSIFIGFIATSKVLEGSV